MAARRPADGLRRDDEQRIFADVSADRHDQILPRRQLRPSASNVAPNDYVTDGSIRTDTLRETAQTSARSFVNWQLRLELKL